MANHKFGIGMSQRQADAFWRELVMILIGVPILVWLGIEIISTLLGGIGFAKYLLYTIGFVGWIVALYKKYMTKILKG